MKRKLLFYIVPLLALPLFSFTQSGSIEVNSIGNYIVNGEGQMSLEDYNQLLALELEATADLDQLDLLGGGKRWNTRRIFGKIITPGFIKEWIWRIESAGDNAEMQFKVDQVVQKYLQ